MNAIDIECPQCGAKPGQRCNTLTGKANPVSHAKRKLAAFEAEASPKDDTEEPVKAGSGMSSSRIAPTD